jgi:two-component system, OmpR family, KDP operon response regulator KdpE
VLIVEDDPSLRRVLRTLLGVEQFRVIEAETAAQGVSAARTHKPDLLIVDLGLPDHDGMQVITSVRTWSRVPIIVLSARSAEADKVAALEAGADDYITKPFGARELSARVQVALRHTASAGAAGATLTIGRWQIDLKARTARDAAGEELHLTPIEYRLLEVLAQHIGLVVTHRVLLQQVWGPASVEQTHYLRVYLKQLRSKLEPDPARPHWLLTETGVGYRLALRDTNA